jgi:hypothetical protein
MLNLLLFVISYTLVRRLDLGNVGGINVLPDLLPHLTRLAWLTIEANVIDARLLATVNSQPSLITVAVRDFHQSRLMGLLSSTDPPLTKVLVCRTTVNRSSLRSAALHSVVERGAKFSELHFHGNVWTNVPFSGISLQLPGLEQLNLDLSHNLSIKTWLPNFARRHPHLNTITFIDSRGNFWRDYPEIPYALQFVDALRGQSHPGAQLQSCSIARVESWTSLNEWEVVQLRLRLDQTGIRGLQAAGVLAPRVSSLDLLLLGTYATHIVRSPLPPLQHQLLPSNFHSLPG